MLVASHPQHHRHIRSIVEHVSGSIKSTGGFLNFRLPDNEVREGEIGQGVKRRAGNVRAADESRAGSYVRTRCASSITTEIILVPHPNPFRDSLRSSQLWTIITRAISSGPPIFSTCPLCVQTPRQCRRCTKGSFPATRIAPPTPLPCCGESFRSRINSLPK